MEPFGKFLFSLGIIPWRAIQIVEWIKVHSFKNLPRSSWKHVRSAVCSFVHLLKGIRVASVLGQVMNNAVWTFVCRFFVTVNFHFSGVNGQCCSCWSFGGWRAGSCHAVFQGGHTLHTRASNMGAVQLLCVSCWDYFFLFTFLLYFFHYHLVPLYPAAVTTLLSMSMCPFSFLLHPSTLYAPLAVICSPSESVSVLFVSLVCSLDSTCRWNHMVLVFLWLAYFT